MMRRRHVLRGAQHTARVPDQCGRGCVARPSSSQQESRRLDLSSLHRLLRIVPSSPLPRPCHSKQYSHRECIGECLRSTGEHSRTPVKLKRRSSAWAISSFKKCFHNSSPYFYLHVFSWRDALYSTHDNRTQFNKLPSALLQAPRSHLHIPCPHWPSPLIGDWLSTYALVDDGPLQCELGMFRVFQ